MWPAAGERGGGSDTDDKSHGKVSVADTVGSVEHNEASWARQGFLLWRRCCHFPEKIVVHV